MSTPQEVSAMVTVSLHALDVGSMVADMAPLSSDSELLRPRVYVTRFSRWA